MCWGKRWQEQCQGRLLTSCLAPLHLPSPVAIKNMDLRNEGGCAAVPVPWDLP